MSHSFPMAKTFAMYLWSQPLFLTFTTVKFSTECAFVRMRRSEMTNPLLVLYVCRGAVYGVGVGVFAWVRSNQSERML